MVQIFKYLVISTVLVAAPLQSSSGEQKYEIMRNTLHTKDEVIKCWVSAKKLSSKLKTLSPAGILELYRNEECAITSLQSPLSDYDNPNIEFSSAVVLGVKYLKAHPERFKEITNGGGSEFLKREPSGALLEILRLRAPDSPERWELEWDSDYKNFIQKFSYVHKGSSKGKTCGKYYDDYAKGHKELLEIYSQKEIEDIKADCESDRLEYKKGLKSLLERYKDKPIIPKLFDPDETNIISDMYFGIC